MRFGNYSALVSEGVESGEGYVRLPHGQPYTLRLGNHSSRRCHATVRLDGREVGTWVMNANDTIRLERGAEDAGRFTFYAAGTSEHAAVGGDALPAADRGLVQVEFTPEKYHQPTPTSNPAVLHAKGLTRGGAGGQLMSHGGLESLRGACSFAPKEKTVGGVTGLSGHSTQQFRTAAPLDLDESGKTVLSLRLVLREDGPRPVRDVRQPAGNPVPAPVG